MATRTSFPVRLVIYLILTAGAVVFLFPLLWMISTSLKPIEETMKVPPQVILQIELPSKCL